MTRKIKADLDNRNQDPPNTLNKILTDMLIDAHTIVSLVRECCAKEEFIDLDKAYTAARDLSLAKESLFMLLGML